MSGRTRNGSGAHWLRRSLPLLLGLLLAAMAPTGAQQIPPALLQERQPRSQPL